MSGKKAGWLQATEEWMPGLKTTKECQKRISPGDERVESYEGKKEFAKYGHKKEEEAYANVNQKEN